MLKRPTIPLLLLLCCCVLRADAPPGPAAYSLDFDKLDAAGKLPEDFLVLNGKFAVREVGGNKLLELPGEPLDGFGLLFGPGDHAAVDVTGRVWAASTGKRYPEFGVGAGDAGGHKLWVMPGRRELAVRKGDEPAAVVPLEGWKSETWTNLRLRIDKAGEGKWTVRGKVWPEGTAEPTEWMVSFDDEEEPSAGRASVWGNPYSGKSIRFDDLTVKPAAGE